MQKPSESELWLEFHRPVRAISDFLKWHWHNIRAAQEEIHAAKTYGCLDAPERIPAGSTVRPFMATAPASRITIR